MLCALCTNAFDSQNGHVDACEQRNISQNRHEDNMFRMTDSAGRTMTDGVIHPMNMQHSTGNPPYLIRPYSFDPVWLRMTAG